MEPEDNIPAIETGVPPAAELTEARATEAMPLPLAQMDPPEPPETRFLKWAFLSTKGLRAGWSIAAFLALFILFTVLAGGVLMLVTHKGHFGGGGQNNQAAATLSPGSTIAQEGAMVFGLLCATLVMGLIERRRITAYYLGGPRPVCHFAWGLAGGFGTLSLLIGALYAGHWITFGPVALSGIAIWQNALLWAIGFALVGLSEEGLFRCYFLFTLRRGFMESSLGFWLAALVSSLLFAGAHMGNTGESAFGVVCTGSIGFVFCMSVRYTGSLWWAIGYHAAWDWAQTFFYGTADSGLVAKGHYLTTAAAGNPLWSGGSVGPEGSLLIAPVIAITALGLWLAWGRKGAPEQAPVLELASASDHAAVD